MSKTVKELLAELLNHSWVVFLLLGAVLLIVGTSHRISVKG